MRRLKTRRERLKSALYLRLKMRKRLKIVNVKGGPLGFINIYSVVKKTRKGDSFETLKNFRKKSQNAEKKLNLLVSSGFVGYGLKSKK